MMEFLVAMLTAAFVENAVFSRALVGESIWKRQQRPMQAAVFLGMVTLLTTVLSTAMWGIRTLPTPTAMRALWVLLAALMLLWLCYLILYHLAARWMPEAAFARILSVMPKAAFSAVSLGTLLLVASRSFSLAESVGFGLGAGAGFALAVLLISWGERQLRMTDLPAPFRGLPARLIYVGLLALAFHGLIGHPVVL